MDDKLSFLTQHSEFTLVGVPDVEGSRGWQVNCNVHLLLAWHQPHRQYTFSAAEACRCSCEHQQ